MMDSRQKEVQQTHLDEEKRVIRKLKQAYKQASKDCEEKIQALASRTDMQNLQSIVYQQQYQQALKAQIDGVLDALQTNEFDSVAEYLTTCYENGYVGAMYTLHGQGIPVITPIDQTQVVNAVQTESKLSENLYTRLGEDTGKLKKSIQSEMSRGIANGSTWLEIAQKIASGMSSPFKKALNSAIRIARTEGGRIISQANLDAAYEARENGADSVKQWNATLDGRTRPDHRAADGQIVELDEYFTVGGEKKKAPCIGGSARNVCNCRCCMDMIPRWTLDEHALQRLKDRAAFFGLDKTKDFEAFREKYLQAAGEGGKIISGAISGALDRFSDVANKHATRYYESVRHMTTDCKRIADNTGYTVAEIQAIKNYVFVDKHDLGREEPVRFDVSYDMAQSWQRLIDGKNIQAHNLTMLKHETMERTLIEQGVAQDEAHIITSRIYNYAKEAAEYNDKTKKDNKGK